MQHKTLPRWEGRECGGVVVAKLRRGTLDLNGVAIYGAHGQRASMYTLQDRPEGKLGALAVGGASGMSKYF